MVFFSALRGWLSVLSVFFVKIKFFLWKRLFYVMKLILSNLLLVRVLFILYNEFEFSRVGVFVMATNQRGEEVLRWTNKKLRR